MKENNQFQLIPFEDGVQDDRNILSFTIADGNYSRAQLLTAMNAAFAGTVASASSVTIFTDSQGNVYVTDGAFRNFQVFTKDGKLLMFIGEPGLEDKPGHYVLPAGIAVDETDRVYVVDQVHHKVDVIRKLSEQEMQNLQKLQKLVPFR